VPGGTGGADQVDLVEEVVVSDPGGEQHPWRRGLCGDLSSGLHGRVPAEPRYISGELELENVRARAVGSDRRLDYSGRPALRPAARGGVLTREGVPDGLDEQRQREAGRVSDESVEQLALLEGRRRFGAVEPQQLGNVGAGRLDLVQAPPCAQAGVRYRRPAGVVLLLQRRHGADLWRQSPGKTEVAYAVHRVHEQGGDGRSGSAD